MSRWSSRRPCFILAVLALGACAPEAPAAGAAAAAPAELSEADRLAIQQSSDTFVQNVRAGDFAAVAALYTPDAIVMPPNAPSATGRAAIEQLLGAFPPMSAFELNSATVDGRGDLAFVHGTYIMTMSMPDGTAVTDTGKYIEIRRRQDGRWLISHDIFNSDLPVPGM